MGTTFTVVVQQVEGRRRRILGSVQITIPITAAEGILPEEIRKLAVFRHVAANLATTNKWFPIFERYLGQIGDRVRALGGNPDDVEASPTGNPPKPEKPDAHRARFTGRVASIVYDCHGEFEGFVLDSCEEQRRFQACGRGMEKVVRRACADRARITVYTSDPRRRVARIVVHCC